MKIKLFLAFILATISSATLSAQEVVINKDQILLDGKPFLKYEKSNVINHSFYNLNDEEILHFRINNNETASYVEDDFYILNFINEKVKVESGDFSRIAAFMSTKKLCEKLIKWLVKDKVLNADGSVNPEKLDVFYQKYNDDITNRTIR